VADWHVINVEEWQNVVYDVKGPLARFYLALYLMSADNVLAADWRDIAEDTGEGLRQCRTWVDRLERSKLITRFSDGKQFGFAIMNYDIGYGGNYEQTELPDDRS
jgi:hypothetical protein